MPASEEDITSSKLNFLTEQLGRLDTNLFRISNSVEEHQSKNCGTSSMKIKRWNEKFISADTNSKGSMEMIDNRQSYERSPIAEYRKINVREQAFQNARLEKCKIQRVFNEISKMGPQVYKDIMNYLKKRFDSTEHHLLQHKEVIDSLNYSFSEEMKKSSCSKNDDVKDEMTFVKEAFASQSIEIVDIHSSEDSISFSSMSAKNKALDAEAVSNDLKADNMFSEIHVPEVDKFGYLQSNKNEESPMAEKLKNDDEVLLKYLLDEMETEKNKSVSEKDKKVESEDVQEKRDAEHVETCVQNMAHAELDLAMFLDAEPLSEISGELNTPPSLLTCFLPAEGSFFLEKSPSLPITFESVMSCRENRLSQEWPVGRNFCYQCNIIASRLTNLASFCLSDSMSVFQAGRLLTPTEEMIFHVESKTCNLMADLNVCKISISKKCESKDVLELNESKHSHLGTQKRDVINSCCEQKVKEHLYVSFDSMQEAEAESSFEELQIPDYINDSMDTEKEEIDDNFEEVKELRNRFDYKSMQEKEIEEIRKDVEDPGDSLSQNQVVGKEMESFEVVNPEIGYYFDGLQKKTEKNFRNMKDKENKNRNMQESIGELNDPENRNENRDMQEKFMEISNNRGDQKGLQEEEIEDKCQELKSSEHRQNKERKLWAHASENENIEPVCKRWHMVVERELMNDDYNRGREDEVTKPGWNQDTEGNPQDNCQKGHWKDECLQSLFPNTQSRKCSKRNQDDVARKHFKGHKKEFEKKSRNDCGRVSLFQKKRNRSGRKGKQMKQRNHVKFKLGEPPGKTQCGRNRMQYIQKHAIYMERQFIQRIEDVKGNVLYLNGNPPVRLLFVEAKVHSRSGGEGGHGGGGGRGSSHRGSANGAQGDGSTSKGSGNGQNGNGSGSNAGGDGNKNNNSNNLNNGCSAQKIDNKNSKPKKDSKKINSDLVDETPQNSSHSMRPNRPEHHTSSPSLPSPRLDPEHIAERQSVEWARNFPSTNLSSVHPPGSSSASDQNDGLQASNESGAVFSGAQNIINAEEEPPSIQHATVSMDQLCDIIGDATCGLPGGLDVFKNLNLCMNRLIHDLTLAANEDNKGATLDDCSVCLILSQLLIHMADPGHDGFARSCEQCAQIFNLIMQHCIVCIENNRPRSRLTQSDLCYKICKYSQWKVDKLYCNVNRLQSKVQKYCDKVLGSISDMVSLRYFEGEGSQVMGEVGVLTLSDIPSNGLSSSATLSFGGNIVTTETGEQEQPQAQHEEAQPSVGTANMPFVTPPVPSTMSSSVASVPSSSVAAGNSGSDSPIHVKLSRKPSQQRKPPAIPPPIMEENPQPSLTNADEGKKDDIENIIYKRWGSRTDDPYETQKTYGRVNQYVSLPLGNIHDVEQFFSVSTRPLGMPGIGEVVFGQPSQLRIVARFWDKKREECERTQICPYQHREEGVILADQKENFSILHTRYQKHHQWERVSYLGNGMSGKCHLAIDLKTNFKFCCKKIHLLRYAEEELSLWSEMHNAYVVRLYGAIRHGVKIYIFSEFIDGGSLAACIEEQKRLGRRLSHWSAINYFQQLLKVLAFLQKKNILHEDIKADNILLRRNSTFLAVTDFGTSRRLQDPKELKNKSPVGSPTHWSPEKASMEGHGFPSDLWAAVCALVHMLSGEPPWVKRFMQKAAILNFIIYARSPPMEDVPDSVQLVVRDLIEKGFVKDPQARPSSSELLQHPAFRILDEGTPETYFSTLISVAHSGLRAFRAAGVGEQQDVKKKEPASSTSESASAEATVLYETEVGTGPYQESDSRPDHRNHQSSERQLGTNNHKDQFKAASQRQRVRDSSETNENDHEGTEYNAAKDGGQTSSLEIPEGNSVTSRNFHCTMSSEDNQASKIDSKVQQLVGPLDINKLLPEFNELFVSGDSINTQSIKSFFADVYSTTDLNDARQPALQVYRPEERTVELPNLSIFDTSWEASLQMNQEHQDATSFSVSESENVNPNPLQINVSAGVTNPPLRSRFPFSRPLSQNVHFTLSSESDEYTSADLFELESAAKNSDPAQNASSSVGSRAENEDSDSLKRGVYHAGDVSPTTSTGSTLSSSGASNLQMRKPVNLTLNCSQLPSVLSHSHSDTQASSATTTNEIEQKQRSSTWSQLSSSANTPHHSGTTPSSSHVALSLKKANGASIPSTASSGHSQFSYRSSVREEQERILQELTTDMMNAYSPTSSESDRLSFVDYMQQDLANSETSEHEENTDIQTLRDTMLEEIDETKLVGHNLLFYDEKNEYLFTMRIEELPTYWKRLITRVRQKITHFGYSHFSIHHMNSTPVKFHHPITTCQFRVVRRQDSGAECWCQQCQTCY